MSPAAGEGGAEVGPLEGPHAGNRAIASRSHIRGGGYNAQVDVAVARTSVAAPLLFPDQLVREVYAERIGFCSGFLAVVSWYTS